MIVTLPVLGKRKTATDENPIRVDPKVYEDWPNFELRVLKVDDDSNTAKCSVTFMTPDEDERAAFEAAVLEQLGASV